MATATLVLQWKGRSGRVYGPLAGAKVRHGEVATVRKVVPKGTPVGTSTVAEGEPVALKQWLEGDDEGGLEVLQAEARVFVDLMGKKGDLPCPRLIDLVGDPVVTGIVMEWCPGDLERWWRDKLGEPDAFGRLVATLAEVARRLDDYHVFYAQKGSVETAHGDLKPGNVLLSSDGRWLLSDFGVPRVRAPEESPWASSEIVRGTENFVAPELLFHATKRHPAALDAWSLGAMLFALLLLRRMVLDGEPIPRNGTSSPRFRTTRTTQVLDVYRDGATRFVEREIDASAFPSPMRLPEGDRRAVRECLRGIFGADDPEREEAITEPLLDVLDRCLSIDPKHRYKTARDLAAALEALTRQYIGLSAQEPVRAGEEQPTLKVPVPAPAPRPDPEVARLRARLADAEARIAEFEERPTETGDEIADDEPFAPAPAPRASGSPVVVGLLGLIVALQAVTLVAVGIIAAVLLARP